MSAVLPVTDGLVAAWDFQQGADPAILYDISGNGHHGAITGGVPLSDAESVEPLLLVLAADTGAVVLTIYLPEVA